MMMMMIKRFHTLLDSYVTQFRDACGSLTPRHKGTGTVSSGIMIMIMIIIITIIGFHTDR